MSQFIITPTFPSAILADFHTYIDYCEEHRSKVTKKNEFLNRKDLFALNEQMLQKAENVTARFNQNFYMQLHLFQHLCLEGRLFQINRKKATTFYFEPELEKLGYFRQLNATQQYFYLFKTFWLYCNWANLQIEPSQRYRPNRIHTLFSRIGDKSIIKLSNTKEHRLNTIGEEFGISLFHLQLFGFWKCQWKKGEYYREKTQPQVDALTLTDFGKQMAAIIAVHAKLSRWNKYSQKDLNLEEYFVISQKVERLVKAGKSEEEAIKIVKEELEKIEQSQKDIPFEVPFQPLFIENALGILEVRPPKQHLTGIYTFKVNLTHQRSIWRRIQLDATATLEELHWMIQRAFDFGNDHLYAFYMDGKRFSELSYNDPRGGDGPFADEITLSDCEELEINRKIFYLFDFGTEWHFDVVLESIETDAQPLKEGKIIESKGDAPEQYPSRGDDEW